MKKKILYIGLGFLIIGYFVVDNRINTDYNDYKTIGIKNNELLILKRNNVFSILEITNQTTKPEQANYTWYKLKNKINPLDNDTSYTVGIGRTGDDINKGKLTPIEFGNYKFYWTAHTDGEGFIYLNYYPKNNEEQGSFYWTIFPKSSTIESIITEAESKFQLIDVKKENIIDWILNN